MPVATLREDPATSHMAVVSHEDDDILFMNHDIAAAIAQGEAMTTVFVTAGDAGRDQAYWEGREEGARAAYSVYAGSSDWVNETIQLRDGPQKFTIATSYLADQPDVRLYFLRLPDGFRGGDGSTLYGNESLRKLWDGSIEEVHSVDGTNSYTRAELADILLMLMERHQPTQLMVQDHVSILAPSEHSDHFNASLFATLAHQGYDTEHELEAYVGYGTRQLPANLLDPEMLRLYYDAFEAYGVHDPAVQTGINDDGTPTFGNSYYDWMQRQYHVDDVMDIWSLDFDYNSNWRTERHERLLADTDGDGRADILGFGQRNVLVAQADDIRFDGSQIWTTEFSYALDWRVARHVRTAGDVDGDGRDDIVAFGDDGVQVALSNGGGFDAASLWIANFGYVAGGWRTARHIREVADVNGDGRDDVVGFGERGVLVGLSNGAGFDPASNWLNGFSQNNGWRVDRHTRTTGDIDGDGRDDLVAFGNYGVRIALSNGTGFVINNALWSDDFGTVDDGWSNDRHIRTVADVNGDGREDLVGFGEDGVYVALSAWWGFEAAELWSADFGYEDGWRNGLHERQLADINGDGMADIVGFGDYGVIVALSDGDSFEAPEYPDEFLF